MVKEKVLSADEKIESIKSFAEEIISEDELRTLFNEKKNYVAYDGFEPSGQIHIAQGLLRAITVNKLTSMGFHFKFWVADWFAFLNNKMEGDLDKIKIVGKYFIEVWKACGMDLKNVEFIWTSEFIREHPEYWDSVLQLSRHASIQRVLRCGQIMGREESVSNPSAQIFYPLMQAADIHHLGVDVAQLGMDQRKVNMLARELFPKMGWKPPIAIHHHMLLSLQSSGSDLKGVERGIAMKMSKSKPNGAIFMTDSNEEIFFKFKKAYCPEGQIKDNPVLEYAKYIVFERFNEIVIKRDDKFGGDLKLKSYLDLENKFENKEIHPVDLKNSIAEYIEMLIKPVREHFEKDKNAKALYEEVKKFNVSR
ncbi:tyrosine--tRNA ligase [Candidatus Pacearchaeota archaeon CG10_big_fil_rev_8_21_14_0_10_31_24]|nr:MAG: tyrosine--tRNA ligase [Candidatus Pacearchaeota archaeon CG10_big_fil_rev_8_21_14_0_10_31_24]